jgi:hypothetical protein
MGNEQLNFLSPTRSNIPISGHRLTIGIDMSGHSPSSNSGNLKGIGRAKLSELKGRVRSHSTQMGTDFASSHNITEASSRLNQQESATNDHRLDFP